MNPTQRLKGVCIGAGYFSHFQYEAWTRIPEVEIVAFSNRDPVKAAEITKKFGHTKLYADYREMFDVEKPDFVDVITPPPSHQAICAEAAQRGIHIICQKALAPTFAEAQAIVANAAAQAPSGRVPFGIDMRLSNWLIGLAVAALVAAAWAGGAKQIDGDTAFKLHDTYGFPIDLTVELAAEYGVRVDRPGFEVALTEQRERSRGGRKAELARHAELTALYESAASDGARLRPGCPVVHSRLGRC